MSCFDGRFTIDQLIAALEATTTSTRLNVDFEDYESTPENIRRAIEPLCRCIANLRRHNPNHPLRKLRIITAKEYNSDVVNQFLVAAKQYGIHHVHLFGSQIPIQSLVEFCRDNTHLKFLHIDHISLFDKQSPLSWPQESSAVLAFDELTMWNVTFENSLVVTKFSSFMANVTYPVLDLGKIAVGGGNHIEEEEKEIARLRIVSELIKPSVEQLTLSYGCPIENMDVIETCATVTKIQLSRILTPIDFRPAGVKQYVRFIEFRNRELARYVANPSTYPRDELLVLMRLFENCPTGRYMLACSFVGTPSYYNIKTTDSSKSGPKKR